MNVQGFDNDKYLREQTAEILRRTEQFGNKLYLEFGGKLMFDYHAARVLPGYDPNVKLRLLRELRDKVDIILCIYAGDIERKKMRADFGISYDADAMKLIDDLREWGLSVCAVVITRFEGQPAARQFKDKLERRGVQVYCHRATRGYPTDVETIVSDEGYGAHDYVRTERPIVVVTGPGPGSGKLATCLTLLYHDCRAGRSAGYAKFETFPIWNLPLKHPVNVAYEAATADLRDVNMIDPFHVEAYGQATTNYNRDIAAFPLLRAIWQTITRQPCPYRSPTDMGVNRAGFGIVNDEVVQGAAGQEIVRRYFRYACEYAMGLTSRDTVSHVELILKDMALTPESRPTVLPARQAAADAMAKGKGCRGVFCGAAVSLRDGRTVTGKNSELMHAASSAVLNAIKLLAGLPDKIHLLSPDIIRSIVNLKHDILKGKHASLNLDEVMIALAIASATNPAVQAAIDHLGELRDCEMHLTHIVTPGDETGLRRLGLRYTSDAHFASPELFTGS
ncbi:MAG: DUF1846 domain-containing protein [Kiritimatiellae bacterium]|nr:DUF1846 domain-containing protein [Kiritimatiellia bacterium]